MRVLGEAHPNTLNWRPGLAFMLEEAGKLDEAEALRREDVEIRLGLQGERAWATVDAMNVLGDLLLRRSKLAEAEDINRRIVQIRQSALGSGHPDTLAAISNLAVVLEERGKLAEAEALRDEELKIWHSVAEEKLAAGQPARAFLPTRTKLSPTPESPNVMAYDDFDGSLSLDWRIAHPDHSHISLSKNPGTLTIATQGGDMASHYTDYRNVLLVDCPAAAAQDFQLTTCVSSFPLQAEWNQAGLICHNGDDDYLTFTLQWSSLYGGPVFCVCVESGGQPAYTTFLSLQQSEKVWLRVTKRRNRYTFSTSHDSGTFILRNHPESEFTGRFQRGIAWGDGSVRRVGLLAINGSGSTAPEIDALFDFFEVRSLDAEVQPEQQIAAAVGKESNGQMHR
jgi:tetratricopeptide (TPR) repeat protein